MEKDNYEYKVKGLKKGTTTVKVSLKGTDIVFGKFKITVGDYKAKIKSEYKNLTLNYNSHIKKTQYLDGGSVCLGDIIKHFHADSYYTFKAKNSKLVSSSPSGKSELTPKSVYINSKKAGKTTLTVYEKRGKAKKKKIGTINLTVKKTKDVSVMSANLGLDNDGIFYECFICPGQSFNLKKVVVNRYLNSNWTGSHFDDDEYEFTAESNNPKVISVDEDGMCTCNSLEDAGSNYVTYTVKFKDGSEYTGGGSFDVWPEEDCPV